MKIKKNGREFDITESEIKKIVTKHKINKFLNEQYRKTMRDKIHDLCRQYENFVKLNVGDISKLSDSKIESIMSKVKTAMLSNIEEVEKEIKKEVESRQKGK
jgi:molecular chaperone DnaK (HSP70)